MMLASSWSSKLELVRSPVVGTNTALPTVVTGPSALVKLCTPVAYEASSTYRAEPGSPPSRSMLFTVHTSKSLAFSPFSPLPFSRNSTSEGAE